MRPLRERFCAKVWSEETHQVVNGYSLSKKEIVELNTKSKKKIITVIDATFAVTPSNHFCLDSRSDDSEGSLFDGPF